jgi:hypothetical protein
MNKALLIIFLLLFVNMGFSQQKGCISGDCDNGYGTWVFDSGEKYVGNWVNMKRKGFGTNYWVNGDWYRGDWLEDKKHGQGTYQYKNGDKYVGQYKNDKQDGEGIMYYADGTTLKGYWSNGVYAGTAKPGYNATTGCISGDCDNGYGTWVWESGDKYVGNWKNLQREGSGTYYFSNGDVYIGEWKNGKFEGYGTYTYKSGKKDQGYWSANTFLGANKTNTNVKSGCISGDCDNGYGTWVFESGEKYVGNWVNMKRKGFGTNYWVSGDWYRGDWLDDKKNGQGTYQYKNGDKYVGQYLNDKMDGEGTFFYANGTVQKGFWANGSYVGSNNTNVSKEGCISGDCDEGYGTWVFKSGEKYVGNWKNKLRNGFGTNYFVTGEWYKGNWKDDKRHGQGLNYYANGEKYDGQWSDDKKQGYGTYTYLDGTSQTGMWELNKYVGTGKNNYGCISGDCINGYGVYTWESGEKYVGYWKSNKRSGQGTNYWADGWIHDGEWKDDKKHGYGTQTSPQGEKKTGFWDNGTYKGANIAQSGCISGDCQNGSGTYVHTSGDKYVGLFKNGTYEGQGTYTYVTGDYYVGELKNGKFEGQGTYYMVKTGEKYVGAFVNGTYNGIGTYYYSNGQIKAGLWKNGEYAGSTQKNLAKPEVSWLTPGYASSETDKSDAQVKICIKSAEEPQNVQIFVNNELQVNNATRGFSVVSSNCDYTIERSIKLKPGDNNLKVVVENGAGKTESSIRTIKLNTSTNINEKRYALIIGNSSYPSAPLKNPVNDATDMAAELKKLGFEVMVYTNAKQKEMLEHIRNFGAKLTANKGVGLFFFAGHGIQMKGENYLIPVDASIEKEQDIEYESVNLGRLMGEMDAAKNELNIIILDACRNNPFARSFRSGSGNGLAVPSSTPMGTYIAFATDPNNVASDGTGRNGLYTQELLKALSIPGLKIEDVFKKVRQSVYKESNEKQKPWDNSSIFGDFYFKK